MSSGPDTAPADERTRAVLEGADALDAWRFANEHHGGQLRSTVQRPFIQHPERVAVLVAEAGGSREMVVAALLHDVLENTPVEGEEIDERFGAEVGALVRALSDDEAIGDYVERKRALCRQVREAGERAATIYAVDKLANVIDLREALAGAGIPAEARLKVPFATRVTLWREDLAMCSELLDGAEVTDRLAQELDALERDREALGPTGSIL